MPTLPNWLTGPGGGYAVTLTPLINTAGVLTTTTPVATFTGRCKSIRISQQRTMENIMAMDSDRRNNVLLDRGTDITLTEILVASGGSGDLGVNMLARAHASARDYFLISITRAGLSWSFYGLFGSYDEDLEHGESLGTGVFSMVDPGAANPGYA